MVIRQPPQFDQSVTASGQSLPVAHMVRFYGIESHGCRFLRSFALKKNSVKKKKIFIIICHHDINLIRDNPRGSEAN